MKNNSHNNSKNLNIDYRNKLRKKALPDQEEASKNNQSNKIDSKQIVDNRKDKKGSKTLDILYLEDTKLKNLISRLQEDIVKRKIRSKDKDTNIRDCIAMMEKFYKVEQNQIKYSNGDVIRFFEEKYTYTGFQMKRLPEGYGKLCDERETYKGYFRNGKKNDPEATIVSSDGVEKKIRGFVDDELEGFGETFTNMNRPLNSQPEIYGVQYQNREPEWVKVFEGSYRNGKCNGQAIIYQFSFFRPDIRFRSKYSSRTEGNFDNDIKQGLWKTFNYEPSGISFLAGTTRYEKGEIQGQRKTYNPNNGKLQRICNGTHNRSYFGERHSSFFEEAVDIKFAITGEIEKFYFTDKKLSTEFSIKSRQFFRLYYGQVIPNENGIPNKILYRRNWYEDLKTHVTTKYSNDGKVSTIGNYQNGCKDGYNVIYHAVTGQKATEGYFKQDLMDGLMKFYYNTGQLKCEGYYKENLKHGEFITYHQNGQIELQREYKNGTIKYSKSYDKNLCLIEEGHYKNGTKHGIFKHYDDNRQANEVRYFEGEICQYNLLEEICTCQVCEKIQIAKELKERLQSDLENLDGRLDEACNDRNQWNGKIMKVSDLLQKRTSTRHIGSTPIRQGLDDASSDEDAEDSNNESLYSND